MFSRLRARKFEQALANEIVQCVRHDSYGMIDVVPFESRRFLMESFFSLRTSGFQIIQIATKIFPY